MLTFGRVLANKFRHGINYANFRGFFLVLLLGSSIGLVQTLCWPQITFSTAGTKATHFIEFTQKKAIQPNPSLATSTTSAAPRNTSLTPLCTPYISYSLPSHLTPTNPGLQIILDNLNNYVIYGNSLSQIKYQAARCTPVKTSGTGGISAPFAASTANTIDWKTVNSYNENTDTCKVSSVSITLHINQVFPQWQSTSDASVSLISAWQNYSNKINAYEYGHVLIDEQGAQKLLSDLEQFPDTPCGTINQAINQKVQEDVSATLTANSAYDINNNFGPVI